MKVKCTGYKQKEKHFTIGKIYEVSTNGEIRCDTGYIYGSEETPEKMIEWLSRWYSFEVVPDVDRCELHITCNDGKTTNAVYKVNGKIEKRTEAVCAPSDTFNFATGAQTAFDRVFPKATPAQPIAPQEDKAKENDTLYCIKSDDGRCKFEKGNTYECNDLCIREGTRSTTYTKNSDWFKSHFVPLVKRPAKVGEWVLITDACAPRDAYANGDIFKVVRKWENGIDVGGITFDMFDSEYLVLPDYHPEPEKEPEPVYYSGKVVCTENENTKGFWTVGKVYEFKNGYAMTDCGEKSPVCGAPINALSEYVGVKFIPYLGEA